MLSKTEERRPNEVVEERAKINKEKNKKKPFEICISWKRELK